jgi:hypothetical protein
LNMRGWIGNAVILCALGLLWAPPTDWNTSAASQTRTAAGRLITGPALAGDRVAWATRVGNDSLAFESASPGGHPERHGTFAPPGPRLALFGSIAASPTRLGFETLTAFRRKNGREDAPGTTRASYTAPLTGGFERLAQCATESPSGGIDVSGEIVAADAPDCRGIAFRDFGGTVPATVIPGRPAAPRVAGHYAAWISDSTDWFVGQTVDVIVYDLNAESEVYRVSYGSAKGIVRKLDLDANGTLVVVREVPATGARPQRLVVEWSSPASPIHHELPLANADYYDVRIVDGRIAFLRGTLDTPGGLYMHDGEIGTTDLAGHATIHVRGAEASPIGDNFDFDGTRLAWLDWGCSGAVILSQAIDDAAYRDRPSKCALRLEERPRWNNDERLKVTLSCRGLREPYPALPRVCGARTLSLVSKGRSLAIAGHAKGPVRRRFYLKLTPAGKMTFAGRRLVRATLVARVEDPAGDAGMRSRLVALRSP